MLFITLLHLYPLLTNEELWLVHANYYMAWFNWTTMDNQRECTMIPWLRGEGKCVPQWAPRLSSSRWRRVRKRMPPLGFSEQLRRFAGHDSKKNGMTTPNDLTPSITPTGIRLRIRIRTLTSVWWSQPGRWQGVKAPSWAKMKRMQMGAGSSTSGEGFIMFRHFKGTMHWGQFDDPPVFFLNIEWFKWY